MVLSFGEEKNELLPKVPVKSLRAFEVVYKNRLLELGYSLRDYTHHDMIKMWLSQFVVMELEPKSKNFTCNLPSSSGH